ncbi:MAG: hypothetical protein JOZ79_04320, partial [Sphingomonas sp.]|nr:hypothetical protein [Sphingomonas sp.]
QRRRKARAEIEALEAELLADEVELKSIVDQETAYLQQSRDDAAEMAAGRRTAGSKE